MKKSLFLVLGIFLVFIVKSIAVECGSEPIGSCDVSTNTTFYPTILDCSSDTYCVNIIGNDTGDVYLDCNNSILIGGTLSTVQMAFSGGYISELYNCVINYSSVGISHDNSIIRLINNNIYSSITGAPAINTQGVMDMYLLNVNITSKDGVKTSATGTIELHNTIINILELTNNSFEPNEIPENINILINNSIISDGDVAVTKDIIDCVLISDYINVTIYNSTLYLSQTNSILGENIFNYSNCNFSEQPCIANWNCTHYICLSGIDTCTSVEDLNDCGFNYTGNYSEFAGVCETEEGYQYTYKASDIPLIIQDNIGTAGVEVKNYIPFAILMFILFILSAIYLRVRGII